MKPKATQNLKVTNTKPHPIFDYRFIPKEDLQLKKQKAKLPTNWSHRTSGAEENYSQQSQSLDIIILERDKMTIFYNSKHPFQAQYRDFISFMLFKKRLSLSPRDNIKI